MINTDTNRVIFGGGLISGDENGANFLAANDETLCSVLCSQQRTCGGSPSRAVEGWWNKRPY